MQNNELDDAVEELRKWFQLFSLEELVSGDLENNFKFSSGNGNVIQGSNIPGGLSDSGALSGLIAQLSKLLVNTQRGSYSSNILSKKIKELDESFSQANITEPSKGVVFPIFEPEFTSNQTVGIKEVLGATNDEGINHNPNSPSKTNPTVGIFMIQSSRIGLSNKNGNAVSLFMNTIPTLEWSRAIPIVNIRFQFQRPAITANGRISTPSISKFLDGAAKYNSDSFDLKLQTGVAKDEVFDLSGDSQEGIGEAGTELFLMPQTLVNANSSNEDELRATPLIDRFRPLASLVSFDVNIVPAAGMMAHRTAKLNFVLHDRSRLAEISDFIKSGLYNKTEILIEYGWEHPDKNKGNSFAKFINALKVKEKFQIQNNSFQIKSNGEVDVELSLFTKGAVDMYTSKISAGANVAEKREIIEKLQITIAELRKRVFKQDSRFTKEIRGQQILNTASDTNAELQLSKALKRELAKTLKGLDSNPSKSAKELRQSLIDLYGKSGNDGEARDINTSISSAISDKILLIKGRDIAKGGTRTPDPFLFLDGLSDVGGLKEGEKDEQFVSLAKLMLLFVVQPLADTNKFDDIQVLYYTLNSHAGSGRGTNIGAFPVEISNFQKRYKKVATSRRSANLSLREMMNFLSNTYLEDISNPLYGLRDLYRYDPDKETGNRNIPVRKYKNNPTKLNGVIEERMKESGIPDGIFKLPEVSMYVECVPGLPDKDGDTASVRESQTILRIHVFDKLASSYESQSSFLAAQRDEEIQTLGDIQSVIHGKEPSELLKQEANYLRELINKAEERKLIQRIRPVGGDGQEGPVYRFNGGPKAVKAFVANTMPTIIFGANNTAVIEAGLQTIQDQKLSTINMINAGDKGDLTPNGAGTNGLPVRVFPAQADMKSLGCPILEFTQAFFCDYQTGTTIDNIYLVSKIQHSFTPGKFLSSIGMTPVDAYGQYQSMLQKVDAAITILSDYDGSDDPNGE